MRQGEQQEFGALQWSGQEVAWRVHGALVEHTAKADSKAGFALSMEVAVLGAAMALTSPSRIFAELGAGWVTVPFYVGTSLILCAATVAIAAVAPRIQPRRSERHRRANFIYFGHLRFWDQPSSLKRYASRIRFLGSVASSWTSVKFCGSNTGVFRSLSGWRSRVASHCW